MIQKMNDTSNKKYVPTFLLILIAFCTYLMILSACTADTMRLAVQEDDGPNEILEKGRIWYAEYQEYDDAIETYQKVLERFPDDSNACAWAYYEIGMTYYKMGDYDDASTYFNIVLDQYPQQSTQGILSDLLLGKIERDETHKNASYEEEDDEEDDEEIFDEEDIGFEFEEQEYEDGWVDEEMQ